jgi:Type III restriction enzyme, res subunit
MISLDAARELLDFGKRIGGATQRAEEQLAGAVAIHNILREHRVAYLADEVGMGKTYVALGALALFRHFDPRFRVLIIAPRGNIQRKWLKELTNFTAHNVRFDDLRVRTLDGHPARASVSCESLLELVHEVSLDRIATSSSVPRASVYSSATTGSGRAMKSGARYRGCAKKHSIFGTRTPSREISRAQCVARCRSSTW